MRKPSKKVDELAHTVIGAGIEVHRNLGPGLTESVYAEALCIELDAHGMAYERNHPFEIRYRGQIVDDGQVGLVVDRELVVEINADSASNDESTAQVLHCLTALGLPLGLLINFNELSLEDGVRRVVRS